MLQSVKQQERERERERERDSQTDTQTDCFKTRQQDIRGPLPCLTLHSVNNDIQIYLLSRLNLFINGVIFRNLRYNWVRTL
jgi:hypothetical protein